MAKVELDHINKIYGSRGQDVHAVKDMSFTVEDGEFVALLGPSGCGKTSTLRMIVGLETITSGEIRFDGKVVNRLEPEARNVAMAFETYALYPNFTVAENLSFPLEIKGINPAKRQSEVTRIAQLLRIEDILGSKPGELSGGQQQRVSLGRALIREPAAFILDEVMSHLDAHLKFQMLFELKRVHQSIGKTTIYVTHDQMEALALADRVAVMTEGELQQYGTRDDLYNRPANRGVADFIGEPPTNFMEARIESEGDDLSLVVPESGLRFHPDAARGALLKQGDLDRVVIGLRPQNLVIQDGDRQDKDEEQGPHTRRINVEVAINEYLGEQSILTVTNGDVKLRALAPPSARQGEGEQVSLAYRPGDVMLFDPTSELFIG